MNKYLYGKWQFLEKITAGDGGVRFSDIIHYGVMENEIIRDTEEEKTYHFDKNNILIEINGHKIQPQELAENPAITIPSRRCYCLCLSNKKNDPELFSRFKADTCIEIDVCELVKIIEIKLKEFPGAQVKHQTVDYYSNPYTGLIPSPEDSVFLKREIFAIESEYRIAIFFPTERHSFSTSNGDIQIFESDAKHISIDSTQKGKHMIYVKNFYRI